MKIYGGEDLIKCPLMKIYDGEITERMGMP